MQPSPKASVSAAAQPLLWESMSAANGDSVAADAHLLPELGSRSTFASRSPNAKPSLGRHVDQNTGIGAFQHPQRAAGAFFRIADTGARIPALGGFGARPLTGHAQPLV